MWLPALVCSSEEWVQGAVLLGMGDCRGWVAASLRSHGAVLLLLAEAQSWPRSRCLQMAVPARSWCMV